MNARTMKLLRALGEVDSDLVEQAEQPRPRRPAGRIALIAAVAAAALCIAAAGLLPWDELLHRTYRPSHAAVEELTGGVDSQVVTGGSGEVTITVRQAIGTPDTLTLSVETALEGDLLTGLSAGEGTVSPEDVSFYPVQADPAQFQGLSYEQARAGLRALGFFSDAAVRVESEDFDRTDNLARSVITLSVGEGRLDEGEPITLLIGGLTWHTEEGGDLPLAQGPFLLSWTPRFQGSSYRIEVEDGEVAGWVELSNLSLRAEFQNITREQYEDLSRVRVLDKNGESIPLMASSSGGGSFSEETGRGTGSLILQFRRAIALEDAAVLEIGPYRLELPGTAQAE